MAKITVQRRADVWADRLRTYRVLIDGQKVGKVGDGETFSVEVEPGRHEVQLRISWARSPAVSVEASSDEEVRLHCEPAANPLTAFYYATVGSRRYIKLERA